LEGADALERGGGVKPKANIRPGWLMSWRQSYQYFQMFKEICEAKGWRQDDEHRREWHVMSGLGPVSAKAIDHLKGFDALKAIYMAVTRPDDVNAQVAIQNQPRHRTITGIKELCAEGFWRALLESDRFRAQELEDLSDSELVNFRNTLTARIRSYRERTEPVVSGQLSVETRDGIEVPF
jgi:hypothetical protein